MRDGPAQAGLRLKATMHKALYAWAALIEMDGLLSIRMI